MPSLPSHGQAAQSPMAKTLRVARRLERRQHDELVHPVRFQAVQVGEHLGRLDAGRPHDELGGDDLAARQPDAACEDFRDARAGAHLDVLAFQQQRRGLRQPLGQRGQDALGRLDDDEADVLVRLDAVEAVRHQRARRVVQLRGELDAGGARADDGHVQLVRPQRLHLRMRADEHVHQPAVEPLGGRGILQRDRVLLDARRTEVVRAAADRDDQRVVGERARVGDDMALLVTERRHLDTAVGAVEAGHLAHPVVEMVPVRLREIVGVVDVEIHAAGGQLVQVRLPEMRARLLDQRDVRLAAPAELVAEPRRKLQPARAAADDDDAVRRRTRFRLGVLHRGISRLSRACRAPRPRRRPRPPSC